MEGLQHLADLRVLNLASNSLEHVKNLSGLTSLVELNLRRNRIQTAVRHTNTSSSSLCVKVKVKVRTLDIAPLRGTPPQKRSGTDHTVLPANFTVPASTS